MKRVMILVAALCLAALAATGEVRGEKMEARAQNPAAGSRTSAIVDGTDAITIPQMLSYQGKLTDTFGLPVADTLYAVRFRLYAQPTGGTHFWEESQNVRTTGGLFSIFLGSVTPIGSVPDAGAAYLGMAVAGGAELTPRLRMASAAYAYLAARAANADLLQGRDTTTFSRSPHNHDATYVNEGQSNSVTGAMLTDGTVKTADVGDTAVTMAKLAKAGATTGEVIKWTGSVWEPGPDNTGGGSGVTNVYQDTGIICVPNPITSTGNVKLNLTYSDGRYVNEAQSNSVTSAMITDGNVTSADIRDTTVNTAELKDGSVTSAKISDGTVTSADIRDTTVTTGKLKDATVTAAKLNQMGASSGQVMKWTGSAWAPRNDSIGGGTGDNAWVRVGSDSVLYTIHRLGIARGEASNMLYGSFRQSHVNLGVSCTTGVSGQNYSNLTIGGGLGNTVGAAYSTVAGGLGNRATGIAAAVAGGAGNIAGDAAADTGATIAGGYGNAATGMFATVGGGKYDSATGHLATVGGGWSNKARGDLSVVGGGLGNIASNSEATVGGGNSNRASGVEATVGGGNSNEASGRDAMVGGGCLNNANGDYSAVGGGDYNTAAGTRSAVAGGGSNNALGVRAFVGGGYGNSAGDAATDTGATVAGGQANVATGMFATVGGGNNDTASGSYATVGGGQGNAASNAYSTVAGGYYNKATGSRSFVGGGLENEAGGYEAVLAGGSMNHANGQWATVAGGVENSAGGARSTVGGGQDNSVSGYCSTVPGGDHNFASGDFSLAAGTHAKARATGTFVWSDSCGAADSVRNATAHRWVARARGGVYFYTNLGMTTGSYLAAGSNAWASACDSATKEDFRPVDRRALLDKVAALRVRDYKMKDQDDGTRHIGPVAQDFHSAFGYGETETGINMADADGVLLAAVQALYEQNQNQQAEIEALKAALQRR